MKRAALIILLFLWSISVVSAEEVTAHATVDSTHFLLGDWATVRIALTHPAGTQLQEPIVDSLDGFVLLRRSPMEHSTETSSSVSLVVSRYDSGSAEFPALAFRYTLPGDTASSVVESNPLVLSFSSMTVDTAAEIKDIKPPLGIPLTPAELALYAGIIVVLCGLGYLLYWWWKKSQQKKAGIVYVPPPRPAHVIALEELAILKDKKLWQQGLLKQFYSEATEILRRYIENRYGVMALEQTTGEIMNAIRNRKPGVDVESALETVLRRADLVKFAKYEPGIPEHEETLTTSFSIVERTKPVVSVQPEPVSQEEPAHVGS